MTPAVQRIGYAFTALTVAEMRALEATLTGLIREKEAALAEEAMHPGGRADELLAAASKAVGVPVVRRSRREEQVLGRMFVPHQLVREGYTTIRAAALVGKDHATGTYLRKRMDFMLRHRAAFADEMAKYDEFKKLIK